MTFHTPLSVLFIGGTGTISASSVRRAVADGMTVTVLNRGVNAASRDLPDEVTWLTADVHDPEAVTNAVRDRTFDSVVNFLSFTAEDTAASVDLFRDRTKQYIHISTASLYGKPVLQVPITESTPIHNRFVAYSRAKIEAERVLQEAYATSDFPMTIVRPSHTYDDANPPLPGGWTVVDRILRGAEIPVHGDGTSLWTLTHSDDLAQGLIGLIGNPRAIGEVFHITSDDVYTWDQIYTIVAEALGTRANLVHIASEMFTVAAPEWGWSELYRGDLGHSAIFDNTKIRRFVPSYSPHLTFHRAVLRMLEWRSAHPESTGSDSSTEAILDRMVEGYHRSRAVFESLTPALAH
ncbi:NAD-dependent epimerase/dehydratase family protein [Frondihabitans australicus]|uniref:Nucleoside-diphosphate-sugar epimerase n=1 Tax=Frondihabitans australicus TaxID=386892 RepID=A0A495IK97_9MICO|nr:NAD-dependent epimerase/dehydratase family protein [Frondihabitans australicus]RKR76432.1 nucleoside-diphosphate-sugar epimerase [Frondihabitans australicus]